MPLEDLRLTNNYVTYEQLQKFFADKLELLEREIEAKLLQLKESRFNYLEEKLNLKTEIEALKEQFKLLNSEFITRITNLSYKVLEINNYFTQKLAEINHQFAELNASIIAEFERYRKDFYEFLSKSDLRSFIENNADIIPYLFSPITNELSEFKDKLSAIERNLNLIQNFYANITEQINKQVGEIINTTFDKLKETLQVKVNSLEINPNIDPVVLNEFKNEVSQLLNNLNREIAELKLNYNAVPQSDNTQILMDINSKLDEIRNLGYGKEFVVPEIPDAEVLRQISEEIQNNLALIKKISEEIALNTNALTFTPSVNLDESLKLIDAQINSIKSTFDEVATSQYEIQNNIGNLLEKVAVITTEIPNVSRTVKKDIAESFQVIKSEIIKELKAQKQDLTTSINSINETVQSFKSYPFIIIICTLLIIIGAMILQKFVF